MSVPTVVLGPRTRLATALLCASSDELVLVARDAAEERALVASRPGTAILRAWEDAAIAPREAAAVVCCALGPIHPDAPDPAKDAAATVRDLAVVARVVRAQPAAHVVFVSSVLALSPRGARAYYAGAKGLAEGALAALVAAHPGARLSVLYPGRLIEARSAGRPASFLYTTYAAMADAIVRELRRGRGGRRIVGADARLWLAARGVASFASALRGRPV